MTSVRTKATAEDQAEIAALGVVDRGRRRLGPLLDEKHGEYQMAPSAEHGDGGEDDGEPVDGRH